MNTEEKLKRIKARCQELLALAEKRTPGAWTVSEFSATLVDTKKGGHGIAGTRAENEVTEQDEEHNAAYIAACAGAAEAGWRATIAAIDECIADDPAYQTMFLRANETMIAGILAAWEGLV